MNSIADIISRLPGPAGLPGRPLPPAAGQPDARLREKVGEFVGLTFFAPLLKQACDPVLKGKYGHGGRGERVFRGQLNEQLAMCIGRSGRLGLTDLLVKRWSGGGGASPADELDVSA